MTSPEPDSSKRPRLRRRTRESAEATASDPRGWQTVGLVAGVAALLVLAGVLLPAPRAADEAAARVEPVNASALVCPEPGSTDGSRTTTTVTSIPGFPGQDRPGEAAITYLEGPEVGAGTEAIDAAEQATGALATPGDSAQLIEETRRLPALEIRSLGGLAPGLVAAQTTQDSFSAGRGLASVACLGPDTSWWFVGGGSTPGRDSALVLVNPEDTPADVEVIISGPEGLVQTPRLRGLVIEPRTRIVVRLSREAPRLSAAAWRINVRSGRVVAALADRETDGFVPRGADWIPASMDPSTRVFIPGIAGGIGSRQLLVHAPGEVSATVRLRLITAAGAFVPSAVSEIEVPGGSVVSVAMDDALQGEDATIDLISDVPVIAGVRQRHPGVDAASGSLEELSFATGAARIDDVSAVSGLPAERSTAVTVWLTAPGEAPDIQPISEMMDDMAGPDEQSASPEATSDDTVPQMSPMTVEPPVSVTLRLYPVGPDGAPLPSPPDITVSIPRDRLVAVDIPRPEGAVWFTALVTVGDGDVVIAHQSVRRNRDGSLITGYPWRPLRTTVVVPRAQPAPQLAVPSP